MDKIDLNSENDYEMSESDEEFTQHERNLLKKASKGNRREKDTSDEEVLRFDDSEPEKFEAESDFEDDTKEDGYEESTRAWGKKKSTFYNTDFHDKDYNTYTEKEEEIAILEAKEAMEIQKRLAQELNETDFNIDMFSLPIESEDSQKVTNKVSTAKTDLSDLNKKQKLALFKAEAPEFDGLVKDFTTRMVEYKEMLLPIIKLFQETTMSHPFLNFIKSRSALILNYCSNISFYLMLKAKRMKIKNHPIVKRLVQFSQLLNQLDDIFEYVIRPQIESLLSDEKQNVLKIIESLKVTGEGDESHSEDEANKNLINKSLFNKEYSESENESDVVDESGKRQITRQIAKNKGLTATKRRELRNPRVKNKIKFKKALKRRKGAVQPIRSKAPLYTGEATGIKTHVKRSIKIK